MPGPSGTGWRFIPRTLNIANLNAYSPVMRITFSILLTLALLTGQTIANDLRVGIIGDGLPGQDPQVTQAILHALEPVASTPRVIQPDELTGPDVLKEIDL